MGVVEIILRRGTAVLQIVSWPAYILALPALNHRQPFCLGVVPHRTQAASLLLRRVTRGCGVRPFLQPSRLATMYC